jgi:hypothetical protein
MAVLRIDWKRFSESIGRELNVIERQQPMAEAPPPLATHWKSSLEQELREALPRERQELAIAHLEPIAHSILGLPPAERIHPRQPLRAIGLDSLLSLELRDQIGRRIGRRLPATLLFEQPTLESLAGYVLDELGLATVTGSDALHQLSADELGALLDRELLENGSGRAV